MFHLSSLVHEHRFKVVLTGEGADELFAGYDQFKEDKIRRFWARSPSSPWRKRLLDRLEPNIPGTNERARGFWYAFFQRDLENVGRRAYSHLTRWHNGVSMLGLLREEIVRNLGDGDGRVSAAGMPATAERWISRTETSVPAGFDRWQPLSKAQYWECRQLLSGYLLSSQGDRMAMAHSVEGRYPFLDLHLYELTRRMPPHLKLRSLKEKYLLKKAFARELPREILERTKNPYRAPEAHCFVGPSYRANLHERLSAATLASQGIFNSEAVQKLLMRIENSQVVSARDNMAFILLLSSQIFHEKFVLGTMQPGKLPAAETPIIIKNFLGVGGA